MPSTNSSELCDFRIAVDLDDAFTDDDGKDERPDWVPAKLAGAITRCDGPKGHAGDHIGGCFDQQIVVVLSQWTDAEGGRPYKLLDREGNTL